MMAMMKQHSGHCNNESKHKESQPIHWHARSEGSSQQNDKQPQGVAVLNISSEKQNLQFHWTGMMFTKEAPSFLFVSLLQLMASLSSAARLNGKQMFFFFHLSFQLDGIFVARSALNDHMIVSVSSKQTTSEIPSSSEDLFKSSFLWKENHSMRS